jgi:predicted GNAT family acetyltransferase
MTTLDPGEVAVEHDAAAQRFVARLGGETAVLQYRRFPTRIVFVHTEVPAAFRGHGVADTLAHAGLEYARAQHLTVVPLCPFVAAYIQRHPEYQELVQQR